MTQHVNFSRRYASYRAKMLSAGPGRVARNLEQVAIAGLGQSHGIAGVLEIGVRDDDLFARFRHQHHGRGRALNGVLADHGGEAGIEPRKRQRRAEFRDAGGCDIDSFFGREQAFGNMFGDGLALSAHGFSFPPRWSRSWWWISGRVAALFFHEAVERQQ